MLNIIRHKTETVKDEVLNEIVFMGILESPSKNLNIYIAQLELLKAMKPQGW
jgi:hypothetical protein